jgi:hypothetical protein
MANTDDIDPQGEGTTTSRRALFGAASGLFLPEWVEDTVARRGANGGKLGGRRGKNRRGRDRDRRHRNHDKDKRQDRAPGSGSPFRNSRLTIANKTGARIFISPYFQEKTAFDSYDDPVSDGLVELANQAEWRYNPERFRVGASIEIDGYAELVDVNVRNVSAWFPRGGVMSGVVLTLGGGGGTEVVPEQAFPGGHFDNGPIGTTGMEAVLTRGNDTVYIEWRFALMKK